MESEQLWVDEALFRDEDGYEGDVFHANPEPHIGVGQFYLAELYGTQGRVGVKYV